MACAFTHDLGSMIVMRGLQGFAGGMLIPMAFTMVLTKLPKAQQPIGLALFALSVTFAPAIGPTIGGYLTENYGWQTIFFVNTPPSASWSSRSPSRSSATPMQLGLLKEGDWAGIVTMAIGLSALQTVLEEGNKDDWFDSPFIVNLAIVAAVFLTAFVGIELTVQKPLVNLRLLQASATSASACSSTCWSASRCSAPSTSCRSISARCSATTPSRSATCSPGRACRSCS